MRKSNRILARTFKYLNRLNFCQYKEGYFKHISVLKQIPYEIYDLEPTNNNYVYRAVMNQPNIHFTNISRIAFNPSPNYISRANLSKQPIAYYACAYDTALIEACHDKLRQSNERSFLLTETKWKVVKKGTVQIICNSPQTQNARTDLYYFYDKCRLKRKSMLPAKKYRTWFLKTRFISEQFAKEANDNMDYYITARYSNQILTKTEIKGIIYPSVQYLYKGFNYAFSPILFQNGSFCLESVSEYRVSFDKKDITKYPIIKLEKSTCNFFNDNIIWE